MKTLNAFIALALVVAANAAPQSPTTTTTTSPTPSPSPLCSPPGGLCTNITLPELPNILGCCPGEVCEPLLGILPGLGVCIFSDR